MSTMTGETSLNLENDVERAIVLLDRLRTTSEIPEAKFRGRQSGPEPPHFPVGPQYGGTVRRTRSETSCIAL